MFGSIGRANNRFQFSGKNRVFFPISIPISMLFYLRFVPLSHRSPKFQRIQSIPNWPLSPYKKGIHQRRELWLILCSIPAITTWYSGIVSVLEIETPTWLHGIDEENIENQHLRWVVGCFFSCWFHISIVSHRGCCSTPWFWLDQILDLL